MGGLMFVSSLRRQGGVWWVGKGGGVKSNYHNWSIPRVSSSRKRTGQGLSSSKQEHFLHQSHHQSAASSFKVTLDGWYQNTKRIFFPILLFLEAMKLSFFAWLNVVFLLAGVSGKRMTIVWTLADRCWDEIFFFKLTSGHEHSLTFIIIVLRYQVCNCLKAASRAGMRLASKHPTSKQLL